MEVFKCQTCGECCYGEGGIIVNPEEVDRISEYLGLSRDVFISQACEDRNGNTYIRTGQDGYCLYYDRKKSCLIHPVKPDRCVLWPFFPAIVADEENWKLAKAACPGIVPDSTFEEFVRRAKK